MVGLRFAPAAATDLIAQREWLFQPGSGSRSNRRWTEIEKGIGSLLLFPERGRQSDHHPGQRILSISECRVFYRVRDDLNRFIEVVRIFGPGQDDTIL